MTAKRQGRPQTCTGFQVGDQVFATAKDMMAATGCSRSTAYRRLKEGNTAPIGNNTASPVNVCNRDHANASAAARYLGVSTRAVYAAIEEGREDTVGQTERYRPGPVKKTRLWGIEWPSRSLCASELGCSTGWIARVVNGNASAESVERLRKLVQRARPDAALDKEVTEGER